MLTADALHTRAEVAQAVLDRGGDYLPPVKENRPALRQDIALVFAHAAELADTIAQAQTTDCPVAASRRAGSVPHLPSKAI